MVVRSGVEHIYRELELRQVRTDQKAALKDDLWPKVRELAQAPDLMDRVIQQVQSMGVVNERELIVLVYVAATSRVLNEPLNVLAKGASSSGKSFTTTNTLELIGPGFVFVGAGLLLMRGIQVGDDWTHLLPGFIVAGVGAGLVNVPLASTAVGVVEPARAGMASGINSTLRQVGIATGVAALGAIFASHASETARGPAALPPLARAHPQTVLGPVRAARTRT